MPLKTIPAENQYSQGQGEVCFVRPTVSASTSCSSSQLCAEDRGRLVKVSPSCQNSYNPEANSLGT